MRDVFRRDTYIAECTGKKRKKRKKSEVHKRAGHRDYRVGCGLFSKGPIPFTEYTPYQIQKHIIKTTLLCSFLCSFYHVFLYFIGYIWPTLLCSFYHVFLYFIGCAHKRVGHRDCGAGGIGALFSFLKIFLF